jgi:hypothetical protein
MTLREALLLTCDRYAGSAGLSSARVSTIVFRDGKAIDRIRRGGDIATATYERALQWFSDHWPAAAGWPADVPRPAPSEPEN